MCAGAKNTANILLLLLKILNVYSHWAISDEFERTAPSLVFLLMLSCRMVVDWQMARKPENELNSEAAAESDKADVDQETSSTKAAITDKKTN